MTHDASVPAARPSTYLTQDCQECSTRPICAPLPPAGPPTPHPARARTPVWAVSPRPPSCVGRGTQAPLTPDGDGYRWVWRFACGYRAGALALAAALRDCL